MKNSNKIVTTLEEFKENLNISDVSGQRELLCDFLEWYDINLTLEQIEMEVKTYLDMKSHNNH